MRFVSQGASFRAEDKLNRELMAALVSAYEGGRRGGRRVRAFIASSVIGVTLGLLACLGRAMQVMLIDIEVQRRLHQQLIQLIFDHCQ